MNTPMTAITMNGVIREMMLETLSTSIRPVSITSTTMASEPIQAGHPNCCSRVDPAPAIITIPTVNMVNVTAKSRNFETMG